MRECSSEMIVQGNNLIFRISKAKLNESANLKLDFIGSILEQSILWKSGIDHYTGPPGCNQELFLMPLCWTNNLQDQCVQLWGTIKQGLDDKSDQHESL